MRGMPILPPPVVLLFVIAPLASALRCLPPESSTSLIKSHADYSMIGQTVVMTGVSQGTIGHGGAIAMATAGASLILLGRKQEKLDLVSASITAATGSKHIQTVLCDLASSESIQSAAQAVNQLAPRGIHVLANLAGMNFSPPEVSKADISEAGYEIQMQINLIGPAQLTELLLPAVRAATPSPGRVISIGSATIQVNDMGGDRYWEPPILDDWCLGQSSGCFCIDELERVARRPAKPMPGSSLRSNANFVFVLKTFWTHHLARREEPHGVSVHIFHPGFVHTPGTDQMARDSGLASGKDLAAYSCAAGVPWFYCDCTDDPSKAPFREESCPLTSDQGSASLTYLAAAPAGEVAAQSGLLTNACEAGEAALSYAAVFDQRLNMASQRGPEVAERWGRAAFDLITEWATGRPPSDSANYAEVRARCPIRGPLGGYINQLAVTLLVACALIATCVLLGWCRRLCCCCGGSAASKVEQL